MYYTTFVQQLRSLMQNGSSSSAATESLDTEYVAVETTLGTANYLITAAPQCVFPDAYLGPQLAGLALTDAAMQFDYLWPQFYNNHICQYNLADKGAGFQQSFQNWSSWANATAPALEVLVGLPASPSAASTGYIADSDEVKQINMIRRSNATNFDGVMLWSAAWEFENEQMNQSYIPSVLKSLTGKLISLSFILTVLHPLSVLLPYTHSPTSKSQRFCLPQSVGKLCIICCDSLVACYVSVEVLPFIKHLVIFITTAKALVNNWLTFACVMQTAVEPMHSRSPGAPPLWSWLWHCYAACCSNQ